MLRFDGAGVTDVGLVREENEDAAFVGPYLALVADGVGGAVAGEIASATVAYAVSALALAHPEADPLELLARAVDVARAELLDGVASDPARAGMATTLTAVATDGVRVALAHIGDSRAYLVGAGGLRQVSVDHTWVQSMVVDGRITREQAAEHPWRNVVLRSLPGDDDSGRADVQELAAVVGDRLLLCSDGLSDLISEERIAQHLTAPDARDAAAALVAAAIDAGGSDNVTCVVLDLVDGPRTVGDGELLGSLRDLGNIVDPVSHRVR